LMLANDECSCVASVRINSRIPGVLIRWSGKALEFKKDIRFPDRDLRI